MISFVTHNMATGTNETQSRNTRLDTTMPGAASHTMRNTGGIFRNAFNRACHFGLGGCSEFGMSGLIQVSFAASLPQLPARTPPAEASISYQLAPRPPMGWSICSIGDNFEAIAKRYCRFWHKDRSNSPTHPRNFSRTFGPRQNNQHVDCQRKKPQSD